MSVTLAKKAAQSGYTHCACRDCMDTTVSSDVTKPELCSDCKDAGCEPWRTSNVPTSTWFGASYDCQREDVCDDESGCPGHVDDDAALTSGVGIGEAIYCDGSCVGH